MFKHSAPLGLATLLVFVAAALHVAASFMSAFAPEALTMALVGVVGIVLGLGMMRQMRWVAWIALFCTMAAGIFAIAGAMSLGAVPAWLYGAIAAVCALIVASLFVYLWLPKPART